MEFTEDFTHRHEVCFQCNGFYGPCFGQPVCATCHAFLYPDDVSKQPSVGPYQEKTDDGDSGNEEPREPSDYYQMQQQQEQDNMQQQLQQPSQQQLQQQQLLLPQMQPQEGLIGNNYSTAGEDASDVDTMEPGRCRRCRRSRSRIRSWRSRNRSRSRRRSIIIIWHWRVFSSS